MSNSLASQIISDAEGISKIDTSTIGLTGLESAMILRVIDKANREYYDKFILSGGEPRTDRSAEFGGTIIAPTTTNGALTSSSNSIVLVSTTSYPTSGAGAVWQAEDADFVEYTGISSLTLTGVTGIDYPHATAATFSVLYALPSNFESFRSTEDSRYGVKVAGVPYMYTSGVPYSSQFAVYDNGTTKFLMFPRGLTGYFAVKYNKGATSIATIGTTIDVPVQDEDFVTYRLVEHMERVLAGDPNNVVNAKAKADKVMLDALKRRNVGKKLKSGRPFATGYYMNRFPLSETVNQIY